MPVVEPILQRAEEGRLALVTSTLTLLAILVGRYRAGDGGPARRYESILSDSSSLSLVPLDVGATPKCSALTRDTCEPKGSRRVATKSALSTRCSAFVTNNRRLPWIPGVRVLKLADYA